MDVLQHTRLTEVAQHNGVIQFQESFVKMQSRAIKMPSKNIFDGF